MLLPQVLVVFAIFKLLTEFYEKFLVSPIKKKNYLDVVSMKEINNDSKPLHTEIEFQTLILLKSEKIENVKFNSLFKILNRKYWYLIKKSG